MQVHENPEIPKEPVLNFFFFFFFFGIFKKKFNAESRTPTKVDRISGALYMHLLAHIWTNDREGCGTFIRCVPSLGVAMGIRNYTVAELEVLQTARFADLSNNGGDDQR